MAPLRILALHGSGTSGEIWKAQSLSFRAFLPPSWEFDFIDGNITSSPHPDISDIYPGPYFCHYDIPTFEAIEAAHAWMNEVLEDEGPFDAVMGFSQGAALAASVILHHQLENPYAEPLFRFAIFFNGSLPFTKTPSLGGGFFHILNDTPEDEARLATQNNNHAPLSRLSPTTHKDRIRIPTAHLYGKDDPWRPQSLRLMEMCVEELRSCFEHCGKHEVPRAEEQSRGITKAISEAAERAEFVHV